jgi:tRNA(Met) C34 N-acetyltransferase TmcA
MDFYNKIKTSTVTDVEARFNERFIKSLIKDNSNFLAIDDEMNVLEINKEKNLTDQLKKSPYIQISNYGGESTEPQIRIRGLDAIQNRYYLSDLPLI